jgi:DNA-binding response OmpR family regulator
MPQASTILIVDDHPSAREVLRGLLSGQGYNLAFASDGKEALTQAAELTPDVILLDVMMPDVDGFEVCRRLRADPVLAQVPVIMVTALDDQDSRLRGLEAGADDFISKPFHPVELKTRVRTITRLNRYRRLLAEQAKFAWVVNQANDGYLVVDETDHIRYANARARLYLGLPGDDTGPNGLIFLETARQQYHCQPEAAWLNWPEAADTPRYLVQPESSTAKSFWLQVEAMELPANPAGGRMVHLYDVTAQITLWNDTWEFETLVSHKLRTPLGGVATGLELLMEDNHITESLDPDQTRLLELIFDSAQRLKKDILDILDYLATPTSGRPGEGFNLSDLDWLVSIISADLELTTVMLSDRRESHEGQIAFSPQVVELILREILENAKKFHPRQSPTIEILVVALPGDAGRVSVQIKDDGVNLSPEQMTRVWTPYYQVDKHFTGEITGMGLGLARVATLVWSVGGTCRLRNRDNGPGVVVELVLPLVSAAEAEADTPWRDLLPSPSLRGENRE